MTENFYCEVRTEVPQIRQLYGQTEYYVEQPVRMANTRHFRHPISRWEGVRLDADGYRRCDRIAMIGSPKTRMGARAMIQLDRALRAIGLGEALVSNEVRPDNSDEPGRDEESDG